MPGLYEEVESALHEGDAMLHSPSALSASATPEPQPSSSSSPPRPPKLHPSYVLGPLTHEASSSTSPLESTPPTTDLLVTSSTSTTFHPRSSQRTTISSIKSFASSPLNPTGPTGSSAPSSFPSSPFNRSGSRASTHINRIASEESRALAFHHSLNHPPTRGSMILYKCVDLNTDEVLQPPTPSHLHRHSVLSISGDSIVSLSSDSKYPTRTIASERGLIAYAYDPSLDELGTATPAEDDFLHESDEKFPRQSGLFRVVSFRGVINIFALIALIAALLCLFVVYPVIRFYHDNARNILITFNARVNGSGQVGSMDFVNRRSQTFFSGSIPLIDKSTPLQARVLETAQDIAYELVFSDEFTQNGRSFNADHDLIWETTSSSIYNPSTRDGSLQVRPDDRHRLCIGQQVSDSRDECLGGILQMKVPLCLNRGGLVEVGLRKRLGPWSVKGGIGKGEEGEGTLRRLIYWPGSSSDSWSSFNQSESPNIPTDVLTFDSDVDADSGSSWVALSVGASIIDGRTTRTGERRRQVEVDYVRIYQPITADTQKECAAAVARNDVMLDLLEVLEDRLN